MRQVLVLVVAHLDRAAMFLDDFLDDGQPEPGALRFLTDIGLEHPGQQSGGKTGSIILYSQPHAADLTGCTV